MFRCQGQVKVKLTVHAAHDEEIACRIRSDFFNELIESDRLARPLAHLDQLTIAIEADHLENEDLQMAGIVPQGLHGRFHTGNVAVMIGAPKVDDAVKATLEFILMIGNIGGKIGRYPVVTNDYTVLIISEISGTEPEGTALFVDIALLLEGVHSFLDLIRIVEALLAEPHIKLAVKGFQIFPQGCELFILGKGLEGGKTFCFIHMKELIAIFFFDAPGRDDDIFPMVAIFREGDFFSKKFQIAGIDGKGQIMHLVARVIDVVFPCHIVTGGKHKVCQARANSGSAAMTHMKRPCRVGTHEFDLNLFACFFGKVPITLAFFKDPCKSFIEPVRFQIEIEEARTGHFHFFDGAAV